VWHTRINHTYQGDIFILDTTAAQGKTYKSLYEVIAAMTSMKDGLQLPCEGGPFANIFHDDRASLGGYAKVESN
jgi:hypothetical protein